MSKAALPNLLICGTTFETFSNSEKIFCFILLECLGPPVTNKASLKFFLFETLILELFKYAPLPFSAQKNSFLIGSKPLHT